MAIRRRPCATPRRAWPAPPRSLLADIDKDTVEFQPNYDEREQEPTVLPAAYPNLLANGAGGIAVGMATNIPPHNLGELIDACCALIDNPELTVPQLMEYVPGPDFPTGGTILGRNGIRAGLRARPRLADHARQDADRGGARRPRIDHRLGDPLSGEQGAPARAHRRGGARQAGRRHRRGPRRERSRRRAAGDRAEARRHGRRRAEPALSLHAAADQRSASTRWRSTAAARG